ncbi:MAG: UDP-N-acetylglucosamine--N-acetylmuramyl-(pentapeptide) pyrophosphoryl-undecaprenol N-acetylglucosamine transferase [Candidatus Cryosericum sp.]
MRFVIAGGGTGGHIYPAVALAERLSDQGTVTMLARSGSLEEQVFLAHRFEVRTVRSAPLLYTPASLWRFACATSGGVADARHTMTESRVDAFVGTGGYVSVPGLMAAHMRGIPVYLLEQNAVMGRANRLFQKQARRVFLGFPIEGMVGSRFTLSGNPLRRDVYAALLECRSSAVRHNVLFLGGSGGARFINDLFLRTVSDLDVRGRSLVVSVVTGSDDYPRVQDAVAAMSLRTVDARVFQYEEHMERLYKQTRVAVTRGGALALTELATGGIHAIVVPYPFAVGQHQSRNAAYMENIGLGVCLEQRSFDFGRYLAELERALDAEHDDGYSVSAGVFANDAADLIAKTIERECAHE